MLSFVSQTYPQYRAEPVHELIAHLLEDVVRGKIRKLMIFAPPQHGKSQLVSVHLPAYWLGMRPDDPVILTSYGADLAESKSRQAREFVESLEYAECFPGITTKSDSRSVKHWQLNAHRGGLLAAGVGGPVTGHGGLLGIIDDPFENWEQAQSDTIRNKIWEWYRGTFRTRIWEGGSIVMIMTRWHQDDLAGRLIGTQGLYSEDNPDGWVVVRLPAIAEDEEHRRLNNAYLGLPDAPDPLGRQPGEALSPGRYSVNELTSIQREVGSMVWGAEYQGVPRPAEGNRFKRAWFTIVKTAPARAKRVRYWDKAGSESDSACWTAGVLLSISPEGQVFIEDVIRGRWTALPREQNIKLTAQLDRSRPTPVTTYIEKEPGSGGKESAESTIRNLIGYIIKADPAVLDKDTRLEPFAVQAEARNVFLVEGDWNQSYIDEMCAVPNGKYRDQADATAGAFNKAAARQQAKARPAPEELLEYRG